MPMTTTSYNSPTRSPASSRIQFGAIGAVSRLRSSSLKKPPEPLRRAVADCLSSSAPSNQGSPSATSSEASRTLRDYLATNSTTDLAYVVLLEHTLAERERSPAVVARCVSLLKRYLLRYKPSEETLQQIDRFCVCIIAECVPNPNHKLATVLNSLSQQSGASTMSTKLSPLPVSNFASGALVKSLNYVRSLLAQYIPKRSFQPAAFAGAPSAARQMLTSLLSLLSKSFNSQLSPVGGKEPSEKKEASTLSVSNSSIPEEVDGSEDHEYVALDIFKWRWSRDQQSSLLSSKSDHVLIPQDVSAHNFLEVGAAALLVGDLEAKMKGKPWGTFGTADMPFLDQLLQPSLLTTVTNYAAAHAHLRAITALKRSKPGPQQIWEDTPLNTFRPRARPLFQYRHYSEQQPLRLNAVEVCEVLAAVCTEAPYPNANFMTVSSKLSNNSGRPSMDVAVSVLVKLIIDMYVLDSETAGPLTLFMLQEMLNSPKLVSKSRTFDLILNLGVHAHLLEPPPQEDDPLSIEDDYSQEQNLDIKMALPTQGMRKMDYLKEVGSSSAVDKFEYWILGILSEVLLHLVQEGEKEESVWASALSCLLYFVCDRGKIRRSRLKVLDIRVIKVLLTVSREHSWAEVVRSKLICMLTNMFYEIPDGSSKDASASPIFLVEQVDLIGGIEFIFVEFVVSSSRDARRNLYLMLFDFALHQINETCAATGVSEYGDEEVQPIATLLMMADVSEALHISVKLGVEGIVQLLRRSVSTALLRYPNSNRLVVLMEKIVEKFDALIRSFTHVDKEFAHMIKTAKSCKFLGSIDGYHGSISERAKLSWATLHSLLHSEIPQYRHHGYLWLGELLIAEISDEGETSIWSRIQNLRHKIALAGKCDYSADMDVPLHIWLLCGLLKSKHNFIRWGFLHVLGRLLMQSKFLLDESEANHASNVEAPEQGHDKSRLQKANAVIDIMSSALSLMAQRNETDHMNILKMCDILFSQLCLKVTPRSATTLGDAMLGDKDSTADWYKKADAEHFPQENDDWELPSGDTCSKFDLKENSFIRETASMAALLLHGQAIVPMQLLARVPAALFYWPLIQLQSAATDNIALGVSVGSKGRGNVPGATSDIRATLLLLLIGKCTADPAAFKEFGGEEFFWGLLDDTDSRVAYYSSTFLLKRMMTEEPESYQRMLHSLVARAQQSNNEKLLENPYLQMRGLLQLSNE